MRSPEQNRLLQQFMQQQMGSQAPSALDQELQTQVGELERPPEWGEPRPIQQPGYGSLSKLRNAAPVPAEVQNLQGQIPAPENVQGWMKDREASKDLPRMSKQKVESYSGGKGFMEGMIRRGWKPEEAAGAAGNAHVESGFRPGIKSSVPNEKSYGFLQWNGPRLRGLQNMAAATGREWTDPEVQMDYIHAERTGDSVKYGGADERASYEKAFSKGGTPEEIAERFGRYVERPLRLSDTVETRKKAAAQYAQTVQEITEGIAGG